METSLFDSHVHIGQYVSTYYSAKDVFSALKANGVGGCFFSSTTSCRSLHTDIKDEAVALYNDVKNEIEGAVAVAKEIDFNVKPLYWAVPLVFKAGITLEKAFSENDYNGIAIHPRAHNWNPNDSERSSMLDTIFKFASKNNTEIFIHTGDSENDEPILFEKWYRNFPNVKVHLAHCRQLNQILMLFKKYSNLCGDTAFCSEENIKAIVNAGFSSRMFFGTDFPISHWRKNHDVGRNDYTEEELVEEYRCLLRNKRENKAEAVP